MGGMAFLRFILRRFIVLCVSGFLLITAFRQLTIEPELPPPTGTTSKRVPGPVKWKDVPQHYPVSSMVPLPSGTPATIPRIQHEFGPPTQHHKEKNEKRLRAVKDAFLHSWEGYKRHAWLQDEVTPVTGSYKNGFGRRGATLVDALDTLIIMGLDEEFGLALKAVKKIDFTTSMEPLLNVFETTIRYVGGLLGAYDLSEKKHHVLLHKAVELGDMLYAAFDTPNRMPVTRWDWQRGALGRTQEALSQSLSAEIGSLTLEFTRLSQLTGDAKYFDAVQRITDAFEEHQNETHLPGLFPILVNPRKGKFDVGRSFTFGGMSDSLYEYFSKQYMLLGGLVDQYQKLHESAIDVAKRYLFFRPMTPQNHDILVSGTLTRTSADHFKLHTEGQHLSCFAGGMVGIGAKIFNRTEDLDVARKLVDGCIWAYDSMPTGIMPEMFDLVPCPSANNCNWDIERWYSSISTRRSIDGKANITQTIRDDRLPEGFTNIEDRRYLLRPEAIESIFVLYRITGDPLLQDAAWRMFTAIQNATLAEFAHSAIADVTWPAGMETEKLDSCESFWMAETLKYFYLIFAEPDVVSLDEYVFNTEAHPLRRPRPK
ncbi:glycoside hydrolase family 47 protein [Lophiostoma macrostomum CBS 122681]|uniref:alpha-1,2-Mannosidase n=1 Tax=Lophiostoma macrostomum CBS 122681 TaxID=1314788 RepID=A0A6A6SZX4_9PLEO|nr:glycoside hydrolase family 47 protein [Lophiostoma macrostomum CBS 122681]